MAERPVADLAHRLVDHPQLRSQLPCHARAVHGAQHPFPEATAHRQQRIVGDHHLRRVGGVRSDFGAQQMPVDLTAAPAQYRPDLRLLVLLLAQHDLAHHRFDILIGERDRHREAALEFGELSGGLQRGLPGGDKEDAAAEPRRAGLHHVLNPQGPVSVLPGILLQLVQHDQCAGNFAGSRGFQRQHIAHRRNKFVVGDVGDGRILRPERLSHLGAGSGESG